MGIIGTIGFVAFCSFYAAGGGKSGLSEVWRLIIPGWCGRFSPRCCRLAGLGEWIVHVLGERDYTVPFSAVVVWQGRFGLLSFIPEAFSA